MICQMKYFQRESLAKVNIFLNYTGQKFKPNTF